MVAHERYCQIIIQGVPAYCKFTQCSPILLQINSYAHNIRFLQYILLLHNVHVRKIFRSCMQRSFTHARSTRMHRHVSTLPRMYSYLWPCKNNSRSEHPTCCILVETVKLVLANLHNFHCCIGKQP